MPLRMKCTSCGKDLSLDPVFAGASCRCPHCRDLVLVARALGAAPPRPASRPAHPPLAVAAVAAVRSKPRGGTRGRSVAGAAVAGIAAQSHAHWSSAKLIPRTLTARLLTGGAAACLVAGALLSVWLWTGEGRSEPPTLVAHGPVAEPSLDDSSPPMPWEPVRAIRKADPRSSYFGIPLDGQTVGLVVDNDRSMAPYVDRLAAATNALTHSPHLEGRRFGIVRPVNRDRSFVVEVAEPSGDLEGARGMLVARIPTGDTDLPRAVLTTRGWYADQLFIVLSKQVDAHQMALLTQAAEQSGAVTHVVALGQAAEQDLSPIADATGGRFIPVTDELLDEVVRLSEKAESAPPVEVQPQPQP
jgi:DNA-directed RNA polymerase subunit RPC12/RpoP